MACLLNFNWRQTRHLLTGHLGCSRLMSRQQYETNTKLLTQHEREPILKTLAPDPSIFHFA
jgi:hypothetical protein